VFLVIGVAVRALDDSQYQLCTTVRVEPEQLDSLVDVLAANEVGEQPELPGANVRETVFSDVFHGRSV
jgi:hypothetical protein